MIEGARNGGVKGGAAAALPPRVGVPRLLQPALFFRRPGQFTDWCRRRYGSAFVLWLPPWRDVAVFTDPHDVQALYASDRIGGPLDGGPAYRKLFELLMGSRSLLAVDGAEHLRLRRMVVRAFRGQRLDAHRGPIEELAAAEVERWPVGRRLVLQPAMQQLTLGVMLRSVFGVTDADHERDLRRLLPAVVNPGLLMQAQIVVPALRRLGPGRGYERLLEEARGVIRAAAERRRYVADLDERTDMLSLLLRMTDERGVPLSEVELVDQLMAISRPGTSRPPPR